MAQQPTILSREQRRSLVQKVIESEAFRRAPAMRAFLLYITAQAEAGRGDQLKEQTIGVEVLGRKPDYNPANDNIVRVRAHELRGRLERYFASEGLEEAVVITIPKGGYAPEYLQRKPLSHSALASSAEETVHSAAPRQSELRPERTWRSVWKIAALAVVLVAVSGGIILARRAAKNPPTTATAHAPGAIRDFWAQFFASPNPELKVVYADSSIALWQRLNNQDINLGDYLSHRYLKADHPNAKGMLLEVVSQRSTSPADMAISLHLQALATQLGGQLNAQFARNINADFLNRGNLVLIGSRRSNPWVELYERNLNFQVRLDPKTGSPFFLNRTARQHESSAYIIPAARDGHQHPERQFILQTEENEVVSYGVVALLRGCGTNRLTVILEGLNLQATQAAGDLVTEPQLLQRLYQNVGHKSGTNVAPFEALFTITSLPGGYDDPRIVAYRTAPAESCVAD
jgi:hypothetical protein